MPFLLLTIQRLLATWLIPSLGLLLNYLKVRKGKMALTHGKTSSQYISISHLFPPLTDSFINVIVLRRIVLNMLRIYMGPRTLMFPKIINSDFLWATLWFVETLAFADESISSAWQFNHLPASHSTTPALLIEKSNIL